MRDITKYSRIPVFYYCNTNIAGVTEQNIVENCPGGDLIRVDLIRFPGSIPGAR